MINTLRFYSFNDSAYGRIVTKDNDWTVVFSRNPYGKHNLVLVEDGRAIRHGNVAVLAALLRWADRRAYRRARKFLARRGVLVDAAFEVDEVDAAA